MNNKKDHVILCGYSKTAANVKSIFSRYNVVAYAFSEKAIINNNYLKKNIPVISFSEIQQISFDYIIICSSIKSSVELFDALIDNNIDKEQINFLFNNEIVSYDSWILQKKLLSLEELILSLKEDIERIEKKLSLQDNVYRIENTKFFVPNYPIDFIQKHIVDTSSFFEQDILESLDNFIPPNSVIFDIGANIGNHTLYWAKKRNQNIIYAFEPVKDTYKILCKNIEINELKNVYTYNVGFSDTKTKASEIKFRIQNTGDTHLKHDENGPYKLVTLDQFVEENHIEKIDFIKIDVEDMEINVLKGSIKTLEKKSPIIFVESYDDYITTVRLFLEKIGYSLIKNYPHHNYLFIKVNSK